MKCVKFLVVEPGGYQAHELSLELESVHVNVLTFTPHKNEGKTVEIDNYALGVFYHLLEDSPLYRRAVIRNFCGFSKVKLLTKPPSRLPIDYKLNEIVSKTCIERRELEHTMSWLSTLGGAFSALGDGIQRCAVVAGKISIHQLRIAMRLGDPFTVIRCKLYCALSLIQLGRFRAAREIVKTQYEAARSGPVIDEKVVAMCQGIWAKLRYDRRHRKSKQSQ